ncbi:MAG: hypothetical protein Q7R70_03450 [Candidatus Diapherotrites archaeon]|nr:hypothetical protein [Candidatus Diapherotrites archaeon]
MRKFFVLGIVLLVFSLLFLSGCAEQKIGPGVDNNSASNPGNATGAASSIPMPPANPEEGNAEVPILPI